MTKHQAVISACLIAITAASAFGQNLQPYIAEMNKALDKNITNGSVGSVELLEGHILSFNFAVPGPTIVLLVEGGSTVESTKWAVLTTNVMSIKVDLKSLNEDTITEAPVFSTEAVTKYRVGDKGDLLVIGFSSKGSPSILTTTADKKKIANLPAGKITEGQSGTVTDQAKQAWLVFSDRNSARAFEKALRAAIVVAKAE